MTRFELPAAVGDMVLLDELARGPVTSVYLCSRGHLEGISSLFAMKTLDLRVGSPSSGLQRFLDEARLISQLTHGNICHVIDVGRAEGILYIAMELVQGKTLLGFFERLDMLRLQCPLPVAVHLLQQLLDALDYAHRFADPRTKRHANIVHRALSLEDVMVSYEGQLKVLDFGAASSAMQIAETAQHEVMGNLAYMSPEQFDGRDVDARADIFSAAVMLTELVTGTRFFESARGPGVRVYPAERGHRPPGYGEIPPKLRAVLDRALAYDPNDRFPRVSDFIDALRDFQIEERHRVRGAQIQELMSTLFAQEIDLERRHLDHMLDRARVLFAKGPELAHQLTQTIEVSVHIGSSATPTALQASPSLVSERPTVVVDEQLLETSTQPLPTVMGVRLFSSDAPESADSGGFDEDTINSEPRASILPDDAEPAVSISDAKTALFIDVGDEQEETLLQPELPPTEDDSRLDAPAFTGRHRGVPAPVLFASEVHDTTPGLDTVPTLPRYERKKSREQGERPGRRDGLDGVIFEEPTVQDVFSGVGNSSRLPTATDEGVADDEDSAE